MTRSVAAVFAAAMFAAVAPAQCCDGGAATADAGGLLGRLNRPFVPGVPSLPGVPVPSPLGLLAPRLSYLERFQSVGGFGVPDGRVALVGAAFPRVAPVLALAQGVPTPQAGFTTGLSVLSPRLATGVAILQERRAARGCP